MSPGSGTDSELLLAIRNGDKTAFRALFARHRPVSFTVVRKCGAEDARDVVSAVWEQVWRQPPVHVDNFEGWLRTALARSSMRVIAPPADVWEYDAHPSPRTSPTRGVARSQARELLDLALTTRQITHTEHRALVEHAMGTRPSEAARTEGVTPNAWADRVRRAKRKLQRMVT